MKDIFVKLKDKMGPLGQYMHQSYGYFSFPKLEGELGPHMKFKGKEVLNWSLNDYLGLVNHPEVRECDARLAAKYGIGYPMGSRMLTGNTESHEKLERILSFKKNKEDTMLLNFGYQGVLSCLDSLLSRHDVALYDKESHACIIDGLRLHQGKRSSFKHNDIQDLERQLKLASESLAHTEGGILVITEGVFGMNGHQGKLKEIVALKTKYNFRLFVDDAHGFGYMGQTGSGTDEEQHCQEGVDLYFSTFVKSMGSIGAFVSGKQEIIAYLRYNMRSQIYAKSLPIMIVEGVIERLRIVKENPQFKENLLKIGKAIQEDLRKNGFSIGDTQTPITPVHMYGSAGLACCISADLRESYGIFCSVVIPPVTPPGNIIYRIIPTASHTIEDVERTVASFAAIKEKQAQGVYETNEMPSKGMLPSLQVSEEERSIVA